MSGAHAPLAPSGAFRWAADDGCRGAAQMERRYPDDEESEAAREGTAAHWWLSETLLGLSPPVGTAAPNGVGITQEMVEAGRMMVLDIGNRPVAIEERVTMRIVHDDCWGTPDAYLIDTEARTLTVWDYKYGHRYVDAFRNWQLILYAIGALGGVARWSEWTIDLRIVQPRNFHPTGHVRSALVTGAALTGLLPQLQAAAREASAPDAPLRTGDHCRDCSARHACPALMRSAALGVDIAYEQTPMDLTPAALGLELRYLKDAEKRIKARCDALEEQVLGEMRAGRDVPLWRADYSSGRERFTVPVEQVLATGDLFGISLAQEPKTLTPKQARDAGMPGPVIAAISETPRGSMKLVPVTDDTVARAFGE